MDQNCGQRSLPVGITGQPVDPELAPVKELIFPVNPGYGFQWMKKKIVRLAPCGE
jgi:hypothetical protein